jgi:hypothetical protein
LRDDGFLDLTLPDLPNVARERLKKGIGQEGHVLMMTGEMACGSVVLCGFMDDTIPDDPSLTLPAGHEYGTVEVNRLAKAWKKRTEAINNLYHYSY